MTTTGTDPLLEVARLELERQRAETDLTRAKATDLAATDAFDTAFDALSPEDQAAYNDNYRDLHEQLRTSSAPQQPAHPVHRAGTSDKYGAVYVERVSRPFCDPDEPIAVIRGADRFSAHVMPHYLGLLLADPHVPAAQVASVTRQVQRFTAWQAANAPSVRTPGTPART